MERDPYNVLGVTRDADADAIKRAYRSLALRWHPDRNPGSAEAEERFKAVTEAWRVLGDPESRARYDRLGPLYHEDGRPPRPDEVGDLLGRMWRNFTGKGPSETGESIERTVEITLSDVLTGCRPTVEVQRHVRCAACEGHGASTRGRDVCKHCEGTGRSHGPRLFRATCHGCDGRGFTVREACAACRGDGRLLRREPLRVVVPAGVATGHVLKIAGKGHEARPIGRGAPGPTGDLLCAIHVAPHAWLVRRGDDLHAKVPVPVHEAIFGAELSIASLDGSVGWSLAPGTAPGRTTRFAGRGLPSARNGVRGDLVVEVEVELPAGLTPSEAERLAAGFRTLDPARYPRATAHRAARSSTPSGSR